LREERRPRVLRIFGPKKDEVIREWKKLHIEKLNDLYSLTSIVRVIKIEKNEMGGACSTYRGEERYVQGFGGGNLRERDHLEDPGVDGRIIFRRIFRKWEWGNGLDGCGSG